MPEDGWVKMELATMAETESRLTPLLSNRLLAHAERLRINPFGRFNSRSHGEHLAGKGGLSIEFADFRDYVEGDDTRFIDWNLFARLGRPYVKIYHDEQVRHLALLIDASASMGLEGKLDHAKALAAAFGVMGLAGGERVSAYVCNRRGDRPAALRPSSGRASREKLLRFIEDVEPGGDQPVEQSVEAFLRSHRGRGVAVVLSDFLTFGDLRRPLNGLLSGGLETFAVQVLSPTELDPELTGDVRFEDAETAEHLDVSATGDLLDIYHEHRRAWQNRIASLCQQRSGRFLPVSSGTPVDRLVLDHLRRRGWVR